MLNGIDVSHHQGAIDWPKVRQAGIAFAFCKATEGKTFKDSRFAENWAAIKANGIVRGAYHFARPANDPVAEARHFLAVCKPGPGDHVALDLEAGDGDLGRWATTWLDFVREQTKLPDTQIWLYTFGPFYKDHNLDVVPTRYRRWIARYSERPPAVPFTIWQFTSDGQVPGIATRCDLNRGPDDLAPGAAPEPDDVFRVPDACDQVAVLCNQDLVVATRQGHLFFFDADGVERGLAQGDPNFVDAYANHPELGFGTHPRRCLGVKPIAADRKVTPDGDPRAIGVMQVFDDGSRYHWVPQG